VRIRAAEARENDGFMIDLDYQTEKLAACCVGDVQTWFSYSGALLAVRAASSGMLARLEAELSPFIVATELKSNLPLVTLTAVQEPGDAELVQLLFQVGREITVDASLYADLSSQGRRLDFRNCYVVLVEKTGTLHLFEPAEQRVTLFNADENRLQRDLGRLLKSLCSLHSERLGHLMIHASGVVLGGHECVLFLGDSRNGKTTMLVEVMSHFNADMLSCDTVELRLEDGHIVARGWPSNFSITLGTMQDYPSLYPFFPEDKRHFSYNQAWAVFDKHVLDAHEVAASLGASIRPEHTVDAIICLHFAHEAPTGLTLLEDRSAIGDWLQRLYLGSRDKAYPNWHGFWSVSEEAISRHIESFVGHLAGGGIPVYLLHWAPGPEQLLRRIPLLGAQSHKTNLLRCGKYRYVRGRAAEAKGRKS
jgi:hypothetical protein